MNTIISNFCDLTTIFSSKQLEKTDNHNLNQLKF
jgi:hypothetical protein